MSAGWGCPATQLELELFQPIQARILELLRDEVRGLTGLSEDLELSEAELLAVLEGMPEVVVVHQGPAGDPRVGCPLVWLRSAVSP